MKRRQNIPRIGWWKRMTITTFVERLSRWDQTLRKQLRTMKFTHDLLVPDDGTGGHSGEVRAYFCGEAALVEEYAGGAVLAFFWTGKKDPEHVFYGFLPSGFLFFVKTTNKEDHRSIKRRSRIQ